jgi:hypothetical protein
MQPSLSSSSTPSISQSLPAQAPTAPATALPKIRTIDDDVVSLASIVPTLDASIAPFIPPSLSYGPNADILAAYRRSTFMTDTSPSSIIPMNPISSIHSSMPISRSTLLSMIRRESILRLSPEIQSAYSAARALDADGLEGLVEVTSSVQCQVAIEFGYTNTDDDSYDATSRGVMYLRCALSMYPDDHEIINAAHWIKYNRARTGTLRLGELCPSNINLYDINAAATPHQLHDFTSIDSSSSLYESPLVVFAASWS